MKSRGTEPRLYTTGRYDCTHLSDVSELVDDFCHGIVLRVHGRRPIEFRVVHLCAQ